MRGALVRGVQFLGPGTRKQPYAKGTASDNTPTVSKRRSIVDNGKKADDGGYNVHDGVTAGD